jgi:CRP-like cAMP-binding protein
MFSRIPERKMRYVRTGLLIAWFVLIGSLFWDPLTPLLTMPDNLGSPFHLRSAPVMVQGKPLAAEPYAMGNQIFWGMVLPLIPLFLMVFGHEAWRRVCPLSLFSQIPHLLGWQRKLKVLNRRSGRVDRTLALLPEAWLRRNHHYFQFGFLTLGICSRILFDNSNRIALLGLFAFILVSALVVGLLYGGKTWCNYFCPISVIQDIYTGPGGLLDSKAHLTPARVSQSMCRAPGPTGDHSICVGCTTNCPDVDLENSYWRTFDSDKKRFMYYGFFGIVFAYFTYYFLYSGNWDYYMSGAWTYESGQLGKLLAPGFYINGTALPIPKVIAAPLYFAVCIPIVYWLFAFIESGIARFAIRRGKILSKPKLRHRMLTVCAFLAFNLFYVFSGRPTILLMPSWAIKLIDALIVFVSVTWLIRSLARDPELYSRERLARSLRDQLVRMGFRSEDMLEGRPIDRLSADEVYVLAKTLPNFTAPQKRAAYRAILAEALETGHTKSAESLETLTHLRGELGISEADHHAITEALGVHDPLLLDPEAGRSVEHRLRRENYRRFLVDLAEQGLAAGATPEAYLASPQALSAMEPVRALYGVSDDEHARIIRDIAHDETRFAATAQNVLEKIRDLEVARFSLSFDLRPQALLFRHALLLRQKTFIREVVSVVASIADQHVARSLAQTLHVLLGKEADTAVVDAIGGLPAEIGDAFREMTDDPVRWSYFDIIEASSPADDTFRDLGADHDPSVAALAISALAGTDPAAAESMAAELLARIETPSPEVEDILSGVRGGGRPDIILVMADLLAVDTFVTLDLASLAQIARRSTLATFAAGDRICQVGESPDSMFVLVTGETEASIDGMRGRHVLGHGKPGAVFGELGVISGHPRAASIEVVSPTAEVVAIPRHVIDELLSRDHHATRSILTVVSSYLGDTLAASHQGSAVRQGPALVDPNVVVALEAAAVRRRHAAAEKSLDDPAAAA